MRVESGNTWEGDDDFFSRLFIISRIIMGWLGWFVARERKDARTKIKIKGEILYLIYVIFYFLSYPGYPRLTNVRYLHRSDSWVMASPKELMPKDLNLRPVTHDL